MRNFLIVLMIFATCVIAISAISWPIYTTLPLPQWVPFDKFAKWLAILTTAAVTIGAFRYHPLKWSRINFLPVRKPASSSLVFGFISGFLLLSLLGATLYLLDIRVAGGEKTFLEIIGNFVLSILPVALLVALLEEVYFRGVQCGELIQQKRTIAAIVLPAIFYSGVHFLNPVESVAINDPEWFYGLTLLINAPAEICRASDCIGTATTLFIAGVFLGIVRMLSGHLLVCIGIHAGWIAGIKITKKLTEFNPDSEFAWLAQGQGRFIGVLSAVWLTVPCLLAGRKLLMKHLEESGKN